MKAPRSHPRAMACIAICVDKGGFAQAAERSIKVSFRQLYRGKTCKSSLGYPLLIIEGRKSEVTGA